MTGLFPNKRRRNAVLRAALIALLSTTGCQSPLRGWRRDEPSLHELMANPQPWDAEYAAADRATRAAASKTTKPRSRTNNYASNNSNVPDQGARPNPYATRRDDTNYANDSADYQSAARNADDQSPIEDEDAEFKTLLSKTDPAHRTMLAQMYQAARAHAASQTRSIESDADRDEDSLPQANEQRRGNDSRGRYAQDDRTQPSRREQPVTKITRSAPSEGATEYRLSDTEDAYDAKRPPNKSARKKNATDTLSSQSTRREHDTDELGNPPRRGEENGTVRLSLSDRDDRDSESLDHEQMAPRRRVQELKPPTDQRNERALVQQPIVDTGASDDVRDLPSDRSTGNQIASSTSSRRLINRDAQAETAANTDSDTSSSYPNTKHQTSGPIALASAESNANDGSQVQFASANTSSRTSGNSSNAPRTNTPVDDWREQARQLVRTLEQTPIEDDSPNAQLHRHMTLRLMHVLLGELEPAMEPIPGLEPNEQEYCRHSLQALYHTIDPNGNPVRARRWPLVLDDQRTSISYLGAASNLEVKNAAFCSNVDGFGSITKFPTNQFRPNQELLLYCEVDNFVSDPIKDGFETKLRGNYEIVDARQARVADVLLPEEVDICKRQRRDYFFVYRIYTPQNIAPGKYQLRLTIEDMKGNKFGQTSLDIQIVQ